MTEPEVAEVFEDFWADIVKPNGAWDYDQIKREESRCQSA